MIGCRHNAKNRLDLTYLHLAERNGAVVHPLTTVTEVRPTRGGGYTVETVPSGDVAAARGAAGPSAPAQVVFAAGSLGTQRLLHAMRDEGVLPRTSPRLGELTRTNSESIVGATGQVHQDRLHPGGGDHLVVLPGRAHPHRARPLRQGQQRDGPAQHAHDGRRWPVAAVAEMAADAR